VEKTKLKKRKTEKMFGKGTSVAPSTMVTKKAKTPNFGVYNLHNRQTSGHINDLLHRYDGPGGPKAKKSK
jgi:hypothetical protein